MTPLMGRDMHSRLVVTLVDTGGGRQICNVVKAGDDWMVCLRIHVSWCFFVLFSFSPGVL